MHLSFLYIYLIDFFACIHSFLKLIYLFMREFILICQHVPMHSHIHICFPQQQVAINFSYLFPWSRLPAVTCKGAISIFYGCMTVSKRNIPVYVSRRSPTIAFSASMAKPLQTSDRPSSSSGWPVCAGILCSLEMILLCAIFSLVPLRTSMYFDIFARMWDM